MDGSTKEAALLLTDGQIHGCHFAELLQPLDFARSLKAESDFIVFAYVPICLTSDNELRKCRVMNAPILVVSRYWQPEMCKRCCTRSLDVFERLLVRMSWDSVVWGIAIAVIRTVSNDDGTRILPRTHCRNIEHNSVVKG